MAHLRIQSRAAQWAALFAAAAMLSLAVPAGAKMRTEKLWLVPTNGPEAVIDIEIAEDPQEKAMGLMFRTDLADGHAALELAIGTGRVALPLSERGVHVHGIELSEAMVEQLRAKPGAGWQKTGERFVDPDTGKVVDVFYDPRSGERQYVAHDAKAESRQVEN